MTSPDMRNGRREALAYVGMETSLRAQLADKIRASLKRGRRRERNLRELRVYP